MKLFTRRRTAKATGTIGAQIGHAVDAGLSNLARRVIWPAIAFGIALGITVAAFVIALSDPLGGVG